MLEDGVVALRALLPTPDVSHRGLYYRFNNVTVTPMSLQKPCPPIMLSSWGSPIGMRRVARLGDGWVASAWHSTPEEFRSASGAYFRWLILVSKGDLVSKGKRICPEC